MMTQSLLSLLLLALWSVVLGLAVIFWRSWLVLSKQSKSNEFLSGNKHGGDLYWRLNRAQVNSIENLPIIGAVLLVSVMTGNNALTDVLSLIYLFARLFQSICHISSNSETVVNMRFSGLLIQYACLLWMITLLLTKI